MNIQMALASARALLHQNNIEQPRLDAEVLLSQVLNCNRAYLLTNNVKPLTEMQLRQFNELVQKRTQGQPVAYLVGVKEFMGLNFTVTPDVLIPRPDTELMVETAVSIINKHAKENPKLLDVGTGSGAVVVSTTHFVPRLKATAVDISEQALKIAQKNAKEHNVDNKIEFIKGNLLESLLHQKADIITANLPYVPSQDILTLSEEVKNEPKLALDGGPDGLDLYRQLIPQAEKILNPAGHLLIEIGPGQGQPALNLFKHWPQANLYHDLANRERLVVAKIN
ncbi:MAG: peptide chain release factor N(5)-glutamine methyltransferase [Firmicutes bacterium]|nr:peptide chain release factor N(5)-glutamine methyltransferase [Bacillota bacterium]